MMSDPSVQLEVARIKGSGNLPIPPFPHPPELANSSLPMRTRLKLIQAYITSLEYNYTGEEFFVKKKDRGFRHVTSTAKLIIREALPIQCVEAVFVGAYLTADMTEMDRYPVCFRSSLDGRVFRHIILAVRSEGVWGALGLSRRDTLMYKELRYASLSELIADFRESYAGNWHRLEHVWVGFPLPHDISSNVPVKWKVLRAGVGTKTEWESAASDLDHFVTCAPALFERFGHTGRVPDHPLLRGSVAQEGNCGVSSGVVNGGGGYDPRGSPGAMSPGAMSPGAMSPGAAPYWAGPDGLARGRRRASTSVGKPIVRDKTGGGCEADRAGRHVAGTIGGRSLQENRDSGARSGGGGGGGDAGGNSVAVASPPRARARSTGGVRAGTGVGSRSPAGKARRYVSKVSSTGATEKGTSSSLTPSRRRST